MLRIVVFTVLLCAWSGCGTPTYQPAYVVRGEAQAVLGLVQAAEGWLLLRCNSEQDWHNYRDDEKQTTEAGTCHAASPQIFTTAELAEAQQHIAADLHHGTGKKVVQVGLSATLAAFSLLISRAIVADLKKVIPITLAVGLGLYHVHRQVHRIVSLQQEKETALAELRDPSQRHYSATSLTIVEEVLLRYLTNT